MLTGKQKLTLIDYPGVPSTVYFTSGCNFRCTWCHNKDIAYLKPESFNPLNEDIEIEFLLKRKNFIDHVCITGGEPTIWGQRLISFLSRLKELKFFIKLDTNGYDPDIIELIFRNGLCDFIAMDIKNTKGKYSETVGLDNIDHSLIEQSILFIKKNFPNHQFRTTLVPDLVFPEDIIQLEKQYSISIIKQEYRENKITNEPS